MLRGAELGLLRLAERVCATSGSERSTDIRVKNEIQTARTWPLVEQQIFQDKFNITKKIAILSNSVKMNVSS